MGRLVGNLKLFCKSRGETVLNNFFQILEMKLILVCSFTFRGESKCERFLEGNSYTSLGVGQKQAIFPMYLV